MHKIFLTFVLAIVFGITNLKADTTDFNAYEREYIDFCVKKLIERIKINERLIELGQLEDVNTVLDLRDEAVKKNYVLRDLAKVEKIALDVKNSPYWSSCLYYYVLITNYVYAPGIKVGKDDILNAYMQNPAMFDDLVQGKITTANLKKNLAGLKAIAAEGAEKVEERHKKILDEIKEKVKLEVTSKKVILQSLVYEFSSNKLDTCFTYANLSLDKRIRKDHQEPFNTRWQAKKATVRSRMHDRCLLPMAEVVEAALAYFTGNTAKGASNFCDELMSTVNLIPDNSFSGQYLSPSGLILYLPPGRHQIIATAKCGPILAFKVWNDGQTPADGVIYSSLNTGGIFQGYFGESGLPYTPEKVGDRTKNVYVVNDFVMTGTLAQKVAVPRLAEFLAPKIGKYNNSNELYIVTSTNKWCLFALGTPGQVVQSSASSFAAPIANSYYQLLHKESDWSNRDLCSQGRSNVVNEATYYGQFSDNKIVTTNCTFGSTNVDVISVANYKPTDLSTAFPATTTSTTTPTTPVSKLRVIYEGRNYKDGDIIYVPKTLRNQPQSFQVEDLRKIYNAYDWWLGTAKPSTTKVGDNSHLALQSWRSDKAVAELKLISSGVQYRAISKLNVMAWDKNLSPDAKFNDNIQEIQVYRPDFDITYFSSDEYPADDSKYQSSVNGTKIYVFAGSKAYLSFKLSNLGIPIAEIPTLMSKMNYEIYADNKLITSCSFAQFSLPIPSQVAGNLTTAQDVKIRVVLKEKSSGIELYDNEVVIRYILIEDLKDLVVTDNHNADDYNEAVGRIGNAGTGKGLYIVTCAVPTGYGQSGKSFSGPLNYKLIPNTSDGKWRNTEENDLKEALKQIKWTGTEEVYNNLVSMEVDQNKKDISSFLGTGDNFDLNLDCDQSQLIRSWNTPVSDINGLNEPELLTRTVTATLNGKSLTTDVIFVFYGYNEYSIGTGLIDETVKKLPFPAAVGNKLKDIGEIIKKYRAARVAVQSASTVINKIKEIVPGGKANDKGCSFLFFKTRGAANASVTASTPAAPAATTPQGTASTADRGSDRFLESEFSIDLGIFREEDVDVKNHYVKAFEFKPKVEVPAVVCKTEVDLLGAPSVTADILAEWTGVKFACVLELQASVLMALEGSIKIRFEEPGSKLLTPNLGLQGVVECKAEAAVKAGAEAAGSGYSLKGGLTINFISEMKVDPFKISIKLEKVEGAIGIYKGQDMGTTEEDEKMIVEFFKKHMDVNFYIYKNDN